ncbi:MAG: hypothetical protein H0Z53_04945 [Nitrosospira sp.]|nr:hypothetical protein [Nitrosospira sp.]
MSSTIHLANAKGRDATIGLVSIKAAPGPKLGLPGEKLYFRRFLAATEKVTHEALVKEFGEDYSKNLIDSDPEIDIESIGMQIEQTQTVYIDGAGELMYVDPNFIEVVFNPDGTEKERRDPVDTVMNVDVETPVRFSGRLVSIQDAVRKFGFRRKLQLRHVDGLTFDFLYEIAKELESKESMMVIGTGAKGTSSLIFQANGRPYRGFLEGRTKDKSYRLTLHLSEMELKKPISNKKKASDVE